VLRKIEIVIPISQDDKLQDILEDCCKTRLLKTQKTNNKSI